MVLRFMTAGDSHGDSLVGIIEGLPAGIRVSTKDIEKDLLRRRKTYGRSDRQKLESDRVEVISGLWRGRATGAPLALRIPNLGRDVRKRTGGALSTVPRPGHADLAGMLKYGLEEVPPIAERASARSTAMRVAIGAVARVALRRFGVDVISHVTSIGGVEAHPDVSSVAGLKRRVSRSCIYCADSAAEKQMVAAIEEAEREGHSLGGSVEVIATGVPPGLGSHVAWDRKLDARLARALMSIQSVKAVEVGEGIGASRLRGAEAQDAITLEGGALMRPTNLAGGIEGGVTNGQGVVVRAYAKPIPTARKRARTVDMKTLESCDSPYVRSDVCVVPALGVVAEAAVAWEILSAFLEKFGGDHIDETEANFGNFISSVQKRSRK